MDREVLTLSILVATLLFALVSWGSQVYVTRRLRSFGDEPGDPFGKRSWLQPFVLGWKKAEKLGIHRVLKAWSVVLAITILGTIATAYLFVSPYSK